MNKNSRLLRKEYAKHLAKYYWKPVLWTRAYCLISAGGALLSILKEYILKQERPEVERPYGRALSIST